MRFGGTHFGYLPSKVDVKPAFPFDLGFAMTTVHKAQGRTTPKVILAISSKPNRLSQMTFNSIFVALSRVKTAKNIRLLVPNPRDKGGALHYITLLKPPAHVKQFFAGYKNNKRQWNRQDVYAKVLLYNQ